MHALDSQRAGPWCRRFRLETSRMSRQRGALSVSYSTKACLHDTFVAYMYTGMHNQMHARRLGRQFFCSPALCSGEPRATGTNAFVDNIPLPETETVTTRTATPSPGVNANQKSGQTPSSRWIPEHPPGWPMWLFRPAACWTVRWPR